MTQQEFQKVYSDYLKHFEQYNMPAFNTGIHAISTWCDRSFKLHRSDWGRTPETVTDIYGQTLGVWQLGEQKFIVFNFRDTKLFDISRCGVIGLNDFRCEETITHNKDSFYNRKGQLIYYKDEEQKERLKELYKDFLELRNGWNQYEEVKNQINEENWTLIPSVIAIELLNSVPPVRMDSGERFLVGEPYRDNAEGVALYLECRKADNGYNAKYSTVREYDQAFTKMGV